MADLIQKVQFKRGKAGALSALLVGDNKLSAGEPAYETDTGKLKIGDGESDYESLPYISGSQEQIIFDSYLEFPAVGEENKLYVAKDLNNSYIWKNSHYEVVSVDQHEIDGGSANTVY